MQTKQRMQNLLEATNYLTSLLKSRDKNSEVEIRIRVSDEQLDKCIDVLHTRVNVTHLSLACLFSIQHHNTNDRTLSTKIGPQLLIQHLSIISNQTTEKDLVRPIKIASSASQKHA